MIYKFISIVVLAMVTTVVLAEKTGKGKITFTQGHFGANCRTVGHKNNTTGVLMIFRISNSTNDDDISAVVLSALMADRDTDIYFDPTQTTGCGTEPAIQYITVF